MKEQLLTILKNSRTYTLSVAEAMPGNAYDFSPVNTVWNFGELLHHIAYGIHWWEENYVKGAKKEWDPPALTGGKKEIISGLEKAYQSLENTVSKLSLTDENIKGFHATQDHITHHRGQAVLFLRCKGITPPEYLY